VLTSFKNGVPIEDLKKKFEPGLNVDMPTGFRPAATIFLGHTFSGFIIFT